MCSAFLFATSCLAFAILSAYFFLLDSSSSFAFYLFLANSSKCFYALLYPDYYAPVLLFRLVGLSIMGSNYFLELAAAPPVVNY
jgi:hypothetical protein